MPCRARLGAGACGLPTLSPQWKEFLRFLSNSKARRCTFNLNGGNVRKTRVSNVSGRYLPGPLLGTEGLSHSTHEEVTGRTRWAALGRGLTIVSPWSASVAPAPRRLRWKHLRRASVVAGQMCGTARESSRRIWSPLPPGAPDGRCCPAALHVRPAPARLRGSAGPARQRRGRGSGAATAPRAPQWRQWDRAARDRRETVDPAAGPAGLGGLGRPLPLQSSEMAEHVAIMPRHSGCPARPALISGPRTPLLFPCAPRMGNKTQHVSAAPAHKAPGLGLSGGQSGPSISAPGPLCPSPPCHTFCSRIQ